MRSRVRHAERCRRHHAPHRRAPRAVPPPEHRQRGAHPAVHEQPRHRRQRQVLDHRRRQRQRARDGCERHDGHPRRAEARMHPPQHRRQVPTLGHGHGHPRHIQHPRRQVFQNATMRHAIALWPLGARPAPALLRAGWSPRAPMEARRPAAAVTCRTPRPLRQTRSGRRSNTAICVPNGVRGGGLTNAGVGLVVDSRCRTTRRIGCGWAPRPRTWRRRV
jgi:hypothetical protein